MLALFYMGTRSFLKLKNQFSSPTRSLDDIQQPAIQTKYVLTNVGLISLSSFYSMSLFKDLLDYFIYFQHYWYRLLFSTNTYSSGGTGYFYYINIIYIILFIITKSSNDKKINLGHSTSPNDSRTELNDNGGEKATSSKLYQVRVHL